MTEPPLLELSGLTKIYRRSHLGRVRRTTGVRDLNLSIRKGEIFGLLGLNGAGKTTTLKLILGLLFPTQGRLTLMGKSLPDRSALSRVGFLPEVPYFPRHLSVREVLRFYGALSGIPDDEIGRRIEAVLETVRMTQNQQKRVRECSKGMLQRLSLAQALVHDPDFLVLDEPITGLDPLGLTEMRDLILQLNVQGKTILFSSHIIAEVEKLAHRVAILSAGELVKLIERKEWADRPGRLEEIFVETARARGETGLG